MTVWRHLRAHTTGIAVWGICRTSGERAHSPAGLSRCFRVIVWTPANLERSVSVPHDVQDAAGHADPRTTQRYNRARFNLDKSADLRARGVAMTKRITTQHGQNVDRTCSQLHVLQGLKCTGWAGLAEELPDEESEDLSPTLCAQSVHADHFT